MSHLLVGVAHPSRCNQRTTVIKGQQMSYSKTVLDHYENPRNVGSFDKENPHVGTGVVGAPACG